MMPRRMAARSRRKEGRTIGSSSGKRAAAAVRLIGPHVGGRSPVRQRKIFLLWTEPDPVKKWARRRERDRRETGNVMEVTFGRPRRHGIEPLCRVTTPRHDRTQETAMKALVFAAAIAAVLGTAATGNARPLAIDCDDFLCGSNGSQLTGIALSDVKARRPIIKAVTLPSGDRVDLR